MDGERERKMGFPCRWRMSVGRFGDGVRCGEICGVVTGSCSGRGKLCLVSRDPDFSKLFMHRTSFERLA